MANRHMKNVNLTKWQKIKIKKIRMKKLVP